MRLSEAIELCRLHTRRNTWFTEADWRHLLDQSAKQVQRTTHILIDDFRIQLQSEIAEYNLGAVGAYKVTEDGRFDDGTLVYFKDRADLLGRDLTETGTPEYMYEIGAFTIGLLPVPDVTYDGKNLVVRCRYFPADITTDTPLSTELPFESGDHTTVALGAVLLAERIDTDLQASELVRKDYEEGLLSMRARAVVRLAGISVIRRTVGGR